MKTTRRGFLATIGIGAAAAALAPSVGQAASDSDVARINEILAHPEKHPEIMAQAREMQGAGTVTMTGDLTVKGNVTIGTQSDVDAIIEEARRTGLARFTKPVYVVDQTIDLTGTQGIYFEGNNTIITDAIAQARADGYNRGRTVESAAWEARQEKSIATLMDEIINYEGPYARDGITLAEFERFQKAFTQGLT